MIIKQEPLGREFQKILDDNMSDLYEEDVMTKQTIENEFVMADGGYLSETKKPPRRRIFVCISEEPRYAADGELIENDYGSIVTHNVWYAGKKYKIFKEVTE